VLLDSYWKLQQLDLLDRTACLVGITQGASTARAFPVVPEPVLIYLRGSERRSFVPVMPWLSPDLGLSAASLFARLTTWLDHIARGRFGGIAGMLLRLGESLFQRVDLRLPGGQLRRQFRTPSTSVFAFLIRHDGG